MKKPSLIIGKKQIILSCLTLMLAVAVYVNYAITSDGDVVSTRQTADLKGTVSYGDTEFVRAENDAEDTAEPLTYVAEEPGAASASVEAVVDDGAHAEIDAISVQEPLVQAEGQSAEDYFAQARLSRTASRDERVAMLQSVLGAGDRTDDELVTDAIAAVETSQLLEQEGTIETIVKSMGYADCIVYLGMDSAKVVVQTDGLDSAQAAAIKDVILGEITIPAENIRLFEVK